MIPNTQKTERHFHNVVGAVQVFKCFPTIQGEGPFAGRPAIFIRLAGCNLQCPWCDTDYTSKRQTLLPWEVLSLIAPWKPLKGFSRPPLVVITGGEPFRQNLVPLVGLLIDNGYCVQIETNGTFYQGEGFPFNAVIVCSPKTTRIHQDLAERANVFKYVVNFGNVSQDDGLPLTTLGNLGKVARPPVDFIGEIFVQPMDEQDEIKNKFNMDAAVSSCLVYGHRLCIQTHKLANLE